MQPVLRNETKVKLDWVMGVEYPQLPDRDRPVNQQLRMLIENWRKRYPRSWEPSGTDEEPVEANGWRSEGFKKQDGDWFRRGVDRSVNDDIRESKPLGNQEYWVPYEPGERRPMISEEVREGLEEIVTAEYRAVPIEELSFDELLEMALQAWYEYGKALGLEWHELHEGDT